ncbi:MULTISPECIES: Hsp20/alpha crystallin family protein [Myxococcus]|uniref:HSP20 family protein n=1 Tax=Myxococcus virescens TaxID=83456 RepID=A0A511H6G4_9BACT|nr:MULTISPECIES: Hsp20/alpha crystallin family protein [Myxococcus]WNZ63353.1 Hsp20/alpha crystallin family protein [Myxococcus sp. MxC21-1]GEL69122.1 molecular chaperone [Myxococcus virescens]SDD35209.1 HSP20 family protein [Myxococcus virescens]
MQTRNPFNSAVVVNPLMRDVDALFRELTQPMWRQAPRERTPAADITESESGLTLQLDMPGLEAKAIQVTVEKDILTVQSERKAEPRAEGVNVRRQERVFGTFARSFALPDTVDASRVEARYEQGVLTLTLPRREESKPRVIEVKVQG